MIKIDGLDELGKRLETIARDYPQKRDAFLAQEAEMLAGRTKRNTPVDSGHLRNAWKRTAAHEGRVEVYNNIEYAAHVEWGHRQEPGRFVPAIGKRLKRDFVPGAKMLQHGVDESRAAFKSDAAAILRGLFDA